METTDTVRESVESAEAKWRALIQEQKVSTRPIKVFCSERGVAASSFFAWRRKLSGQTQSKKSTRFVEVAVTQPTRDRRDGPRAAASRIEVELREGRRVLLPRRGFDPVLLQEALAALEGPER